MILIKSDPKRCIEIPGVPAPVRRPVDIDPSMTGFTSLRTLRIYRFDEGSIIEGHAEEDEVLIIVLAGSIELTMIADPAADPGPVKLSAPAGAGDDACAAYLPPGAAYKLLSRTDADVAYARATPRSSRLPRVFHLSRPANAVGVRVLLEETTYAERLRFRLVQLNSESCDAAFSPINASETACETLVHVRTAFPAQRVAKIGENPLAPIWLHSWNTVAILPGERPTLNIAKGIGGLALIVMAT